MIIKNFNLIDKNNLKFDFTTKTVDQNMNTNNFFNFPKTRNNNNNKKFNINYFSEF